MAFNRHPGNAWCFHQGHTVITDQSDTVTAQHLIVVQAIAVLAVSGGEISIKSQVADGGIAMMVQPSDTCWWSRLLCIAVPEIPMLCAVSPF